MKRLYTKIAGLLTGIAAMLPSLCHGIDIDVNGTTRNYLEYVPQNLGKNRPLLISCHGLSQDAAYQKEHLQIETVADTAKFVTVFPNAINKSWDISGNTDIDLLLALIDEMSKKYDIDRDRVYLSGFSMGGMMTYYSMTKIADKIAAFAPISGYLKYGTQATSSRPVPIIHTHGTGDDVLPFSSVPDIIKSWVKRNNCNPTEITTANYPTPIGTKHLWTGGDDGVEVCLIELKDKGHWISNDGMLTCDEIWKFCSRYSLGAKGPQVTLAAANNATTYTTLGQGGTIDKIDLQATATSKGGEIAKVEIYDGDNHVATCTKAPYTATLTNATTGTHNLRAVATDAEGKSAEKALVIEIGATRGTLNLSAGFASEGTVPAGWETYDGKERRVGPAQGLSLGARTLKLTGEERDFDYALYTRNLTGDEGAGYAAYATSQTQTRLILCPGTYRLTYKATNWNTPDLGPIVCTIENTANGEAAATKTVTPKVNIGNDAGNSFSGTETYTMLFTITSKAEYAIKYTTANHAYGDAIVTDISLSQATEVADALQGLKDAIDATRVPYYAGKEYDEATTLLAQKQALQPNDEAELKATAKELEAAASALREKRSTVDKTLTKTQAYATDFAQSGNGTLPEGCATFDGAEKRQGPARDLARGSRIMQMQGEERSFDYGLYIRNTTGKSGDGNATLSGKGLTLEAGTYVLSYTATNWNMPQGGEVTAKVKAADGTTVASKTFVPKTNIGNNAANSFSGAAEAELAFEATAGDYTLEFDTEDQSWADAIIANVSLTKLQKPKTQSAQLVSNNDEAGARIVETKYYNAAGVQVARPEEGQDKGVFVKATTFDNGTVKCEKMLFR